MVILVRKKGRRRRGGPVALLLHALALLLARAAVRVARQRLDDGHDVGAGGERREAGLGGGQQACGIPSAISEVSLLLQARLQPALKCVRAA